jgi:hypothetical protein
VRHSGLEKSILIRLSSQSNRVTPFLG